MELDDEQWEFMMKYLREGPTDEQKKKAKEIEKRIQELRDIEAENPGLFEALAKDDPSLIK